MTITARESEKYQSNSLQTFDYKDPIDDLTIFLNRWLWEVL